MRRKLMVFVALAMSLLLVACSEGVATSGIKPPAAANDLHKKNYKTVVSSFKGAGFTRVETAVLDDLVTGWLVKDGSVESVSINGNLSFGAGDSFPSDARVLVTYHTFPADKTAPASAPAKSPSKAKVTTPASSKIAPLASLPAVSSKPTSTPTAKPAPTTAKPSVKAPAKPATTKAPATTTQPEAEPEPESAPEDVYYASCAAAKAAGAAPLHAGDPGYRPALDRDKDGVACES